MEFFQKKSVELFTDFNKSSTTTKNIAAGSGVAIAVGSSVIGFGVAGSLIKLF